jgi:hypothetical protein
MVQRRSNAVETNINQASKPKANNPRSQSRTLQTRISPYVRRKTKKAFEYESEELDELSETPSEEAKRTSKKRVSKPEKSIEVIAAEEKISPEKPKRSLRSTNNTATISTPSKPSIQQDMSLSARIRRKRDEGGETPDRDELLAYALQLLGDDVMGPILGAKKDSVNGIANGTANGTGDRGKSVKKSIQSKITDTGRINSTLDRSEGATAVVGIPSSRGKANNNFESMDIEPRETLGKTGIRGNAGKLVAEAPPKSERINNQTKRSMNEGQKPVEKFAKPVVSTEKSGKPVISIEKFDKRITEDFSKKNSNKKALEISETRLGSDSNNSANLIAFKSSRNSERKDRKPQVEAEPLNGKRKATRANLETVDSLITSSTNELNKSISMILERSKSSKQKDWPEEGGIMITTKKRKLGETEAINKPQIETYKGKKIKLERSPIKSLRETKKDHSKLLMLQGKRTGKRLRRKSEIEEVQVDNLPKRNSYIVMFSCYKPEETARKKLKNLGLVLVDSLESNFNVLVVDNTFRRTVKVLLAISKGAMVVTRNWVDAILSNNTVVEPVAYILRDPSSEKRFNFNLTKSLSISNKLGNSFLKGLKFWFPKYVRPNYRELEILVTAAGGRVVMSKPRSTEDEVIVLLDKYDEKNVQKLNEVGLKTYQVELLLSGCLRQKLEFNKYGLQTSRSR